MTLVIQIISFTLSYALALYLRQELLIGVFKSESSFEYYSFYFILSLAVFLCSNYLEGIFRVNKTSQNIKLFSHIKTSFTLFLIPALIAFLLSHHTISRGFLLLNALINCCFQIIIYKVFVKKSHKKKRIAFIGKRKLFEKLSTYCTEQKLAVTFLEPKLFPIHKVKLLEAIEKYEPDEIYFTHFEKRAKTIITYAHSHSSSKTTLKDISLLSVLLQKESSLQRSKKFISAFLGEDNHFQYYSRMKRLFDLLIVFIFLPLWFPVIAFIFCILKITYKEAMFIQARIGQFGHVIHVFKFKTMHSTKNTNKPNTATDTRITKLGWFLRRSSLDELPQIFNVIIGNMSLIGPRPELISIVSENYNSLHLRRTFLKPGITGLWQIYGRKQPIHSHLKYDFYYLKNQCLSLDLWILLKTIPAVIFKRGAY
ncbi:MAG: sugar transferase [Candidatus Cloacimonetes bacterium]|nr:sugar transferase [Candidatus Cloacimonadota bacterium]